MAFCLFGDEAEELHGDFAAQELGQLREARGGGEEVEARRYPASQRQRYAGLWFAVRVQRFGSEPNSRDYGLALL